MRGQSDSRYTAVPWLEDSDLRPCGPPETTVEFGGGAAIALGLYVAQPFGRGSEAIVIVKADMESGTIKLAIADTLTIEQRPVAVDVNLQSNPRRSDDHYIDEA